MRLLVVRVKRAAVSIGESDCASMGRGLVVFVGIEKKDKEDILVKMAEKIINLRIFENEEGKLFYSVKDKGYQIMCIPNFTLCADTGGGNRPSFDRAMSFAGARSFFEKFVLLLKSKWEKVETGIFGKHMEISLQIDGPVNIILDSSFWMEKRREK